MQYVTTGGEICEACTESHYIISYRFMWIYSYAKIKSLKKILEMHWNPVLCELPLEMIISGRCLGSVWVMITWVQYQG